MQGSLGQPDQMAEGKHGGAQRHDDEMFLVLAIVKLDEQPSEH